MRNTGANLIQKFHNRVITLLWNDLQVLIKTCHTTCNALFLYEIGSNQKALFLYEICWSLLICILQTS